MRIGIVGFSRNQFDQQHATTILNRQFEKLREKYPNKKIEIISGLSNSGIPKIAYQLADKFNFRTVGFSAKQVLHLKSGLYPVQEQIIIGDKFGDESIEFVKYIDALIRVGGRKQSINKVALFRASSKSRITLQAKLEI